MTEINSFNDLTSLGLVELLRRERRRAQFDLARAKNDSYDDFAFFFKTPTDGIPPREGPVSGKAICKRWLLMDNGEFIEGDNLQEIWNVLDEFEIPGDKIIRVYRVCDKLVADPYQGTEWMKFRAIDAINGRRFNATGLFNEYGTEQITDPHNLWSSITPGCVGTAFRNILGQWEVETSSLPANEILVVLEETMLSTTASHEGIVANTFALRSTYPNVMKPPEIGNCPGVCVYRWNRSTEAWSLSTACSSGCACAPAPTDKPRNSQDEERTFPCVDNGDQIIQFTNPWKLDAMCGSKAVLRRVTNAGWGVPSAATTFPAGGSAMTAEWQVVLTEKRKARMIEYIYQKDEEVSLTNIYDGENPLECTDDDLIIQYPLGYPCNGAKVIADYDPRTDVYIARTTMAAMMGEPHDENLVISVHGSECGISGQAISAQVFYRQDQYTHECERGGQTFEEDLGTEVPVVVAISSESCGHINYAYQPIRAFVCGSTLGFIDFPINFDGVQVVTGAAFGPPSCSGSATYTWNLATVRWDLTTPCSSGCESSPPAMPVSPPSTAITQDVPCSSSLSGQCGLNLQMGGLCQDTGSGAPLPPIVHVPLPLSPLVLSGEVYDNGTDAIVIERWTVYVCSFEREPDDQIAIGPCPTSSGGVGSGSGGGGGNLPSPCLDSSAIYGWSVAEQEWFLVTPCIEGCIPLNPPAEPPPDPDSYAEVQVPCTGGEI